ncbi:MAG: hypothetical protein IJ174_08465, partial [Clostridia bacterium]|nr:hypothetical protein [Clostridia bacterium]
TALLFAAIPFYMVSLILLAIGVIRAASSLKKLAFLFYSLSLVMFLIYGLDGTTLLLLTLILLCVSQFKRKETQT